MVARASPVKAAARDLAGSIEGAKESLARFMASSETPDMVKQAFERAGAPLVAVNVLEAATPGPPCEECGRKRWGERWANLALLKVLKWVNNAVEITQVTQNICAEMGVADVAELKARVIAGRAGDGIESEDDAYRAFLTWANEYRRGRGLVDLVEPETAPVAVVPEGPAG